MWTKILVAAGLFCLVTGCGTSNRSVDQNRMTGVSESGYPPPPDPNAPKPEQAGGARTDAPGTEIATGGKSSAPEPRVKNAGTPGNAKH
jgi:hypothetical protein